MAMSTLPGVDAVNRIVECTGNGVFVDLTNWTGGSSLPNCVSSCPAASEAIDYNANGDRYSCVEPETYNRTRLRFSLRTYCQASKCRFANDWDLYRQVLSIKVSELLGIALGELRSAILYWKVDSVPPPADSPTLSSFFIARTDEDDYVAPGSRRLARNLRRRLATDPWYLIYFAFRGDTQRVSPSNAGLELLTNGTEAELFETLGVSATVESLEWVQSGDSTSSTTVWSSSDFSAVYQFEGFDSNTAPGEAHELGGAARAADLAQCKEACYTYNEVIDSSRCSTDCQCNGKRWCSHVGECTGEMPPCRTDGVETRTITTTKTTTKGPVTTTTKGTTSTTTFSPLADLSSACAALVSDTWRPCQIGSEVDACPGIACAVTSTLLSASACQADLCPTGAALTGTVATDYWDELCENSAINLEYAHARQSCYPTYTSTTTSTTTVLPTSASGDAVPLLLPLLLVSLIFCSCCLCFCLGRLFSSRVIVFFHDWWATHKLGNTDVRVLAPAPPMTSFKTGKRPPSQHRPAPGPTVVRASTVKSKKETAKTRSMWFGIRKIPLVGSKVPTVPAEAEDVPFGYTESSSFASMGRGARESTTSSESDGSAHARSAWESGGNNEGPRKAANAEGPTLSPAAEALLAELRKLRGAEHSAAERKRYFREQMLRWHPDKNIGEEEKAAEMFKALQDSKGWFLNED